MILYLCVKLIQVLAIEVDMPLNPTNQVLAFSAVFLCSVLYVKPIQVLAIEVDIPLKTNQPTNQVLAFSAVFLCSVSCLKLIQVLAIEVNIPLNPNQPSISFLSSLPMLSIMCETNPRICFYKKCLHSVQSSSTKNISPFSTISNNKNVSLILSYMVFFLSSSPLILSLKVDGICPSHLQLYSFGFSHSWNHHRHFQNLFPLVLLRNCLALRWKTVAYLSRSQMTYHWHHLTSKQICHRHRSLIWPATPLMRMECRL